MPARYAQSAPSTNDDFAPARICFAYWGAALAMFSAPAKDCSSCASVLSLTWLLFGDAAIALATAAE